MAVLHRVQEHLTELAMSGVGLVALASRRIEALLGRPATHDVADLRTAPPGEVVHLRRPDGARVRVHVAGTGPTVVLVHGFALHGGSWNLVSRDLVERGHRVIAFDLRGHGGSTSPDGTVVTEELVGDLLEVVERFEVEDAVLVGHSTGGYVALAALVERPELSDHVRGLVLVSSLAGEVLRDEPDATTAATIDLGVAGRLLRNEAVELLLTGFVSGLGVGPDVTRTFLDEFALADHASLVSLVRDLARNSYYDRLDEVRVPSVVLCGDADEVTPCAHSRVIAEGITDATLVEVADAGHLLNWQHADAVVDAVVGLTGVEEERERSGRADAGARVVVILNPASGTHDADETERTLREVLEQGEREVDVRRTEGEGDARSWARAAAEDASVDVVVVVGGDGTVREVVSGVVEADGEAAVGIVPTGTANLLARALHVPVDDLAAAARVVAGGIFRRIDVLHLVDRGAHATLMVDAGFDAALVADSSRELKNVLGPLAYVASGVRHAFTLEDTAVRVRVDDEEEHVDAHTVLCLNVGRIGQTAVLDHEIDPDDGLLHVGIVRRPGPLDVAATVVSAVASDRADHRNIEWRSGRRVRVEADEDLEVQVDGDLAGTTPFEVEVLPGAVAVLVPDRPG